MSAHREPRRLAALLLALAACSSPVEVITDQGDREDFLLIWGELWDIIDRRYGVDESPCYYAMDTTVVIGVPQSQLDRLMGCEERIGCATYPLVPVPAPGAYTVAYLDTLGARQRCEVIVHETIHVVDRCMRAHDLEQWPHRVVSHPPELFDLAGDNEGFYPVELELGARTIGECEIDPG